MEPASNMATASITSVAGDSTASCEVPKTQRYIPPPRRSSGGGESTSDGQSATTLNTTKGTSKNKSSSPPTKGKRNPSPKPRYPNSKAQSPANRSQRDKTSKSGEDQVEIWQGKRKGGNRAPKIEPEGTKSWRTRPLDHRGPEVTLNSLDLDEGNQKLCIPGLPVYDTHRASWPAQRWPEYISEFLDIVDMHLNILVRCISPVKQRVSFRTHPPGSTGCWAESSDHSLPRGMFQQDFQNLGRVIMETIYRLPAWSLGYLLESEKLMGRRQWTTPTDLEPQLQRLATAQFNERSTTNLLRAKFNHIPPHERSLFISRQSLLVREQTKIIKYMLEHPRTLHVNRTLLHREMEQLVQYCANGAITEAHMPIWNVCLHHHWLGKLNGISNYPALLDAAGFAKRLPLQFKHPTEPLDVHETVGAWLERAKLERQMAQWDVSFDGGRSVMPKSSEQVARERQPNEFKNIDWAGKLSLSRNWRNQFLL